MMEIKQLAEMSGFNSHLNTPIVINNEEEYNKFLDECIKLESLDPIPKLQSQEGKRWLELYTAIRDYEFKISKEKFLKISQKVRFKTSDLCYNLFG